MASAIVSPEMYNSLNYVGRVSKAHIEQSDALLALQSLLVSYNVPAGVAIRLVHKHYDLEENEMMVHNLYQTPKGAVKVMRPVKVLDGLKFIPIFFFVDDDQSLQPYEYTTDEVELPNLAELQPFLDDFSRTALDFNVQRIFGLKLMRETSASGSSTEFEFPEKRSTITIPEGMPMPAVGADWDTVMTQWAPSPAGPRINSYGCSHTSVCTHCGNHKPTQAEHSRHEHSVPGAEFILGGQGVFKGSALHEVVAAVVEVW
jgi:hypothetical protein